MLAFLSLPYLSTFRIFETVSQNLFSVLYSAIFNIFYDCQILLFRFPCWRFFVFGPLRCFFGCFMEFLIHIFQPPVMSALFQTCTWHHGAEPRQQPVTGQWTACCGLYYLGGSHTLHRVDSGMIRGGFIVILVTRKVARFAGLF